MKNKSTASNSFSFLFLVFCLSSSGLFAQLLPNNITVEIPRGDDNGFVTMILQKYDIRDPNHCKFYYDQQSYSSPVDINGANPSNSQRHFFIRDDVSITGGLPNSNTFGYSCPPNEN